MLLTLRNPPKSNEERFFSCIQTFGHDWVDAQKICQICTIDTIHGDLSPKPVLGTHGDRGMFIFPVQLTTGRIGNLTRLIHTLLYRYVMTIHTYHIYGVYKQ